MTNFKTTTLDIFDLEDSINTAMSAVLLAHDFIGDAVQRMACPGQAEAANTVHYAVGHARDAVRAAHDEFHAYMKQEFRRQPEHAAGPDDCPTWQGAGLYRFHHHANPFLVYWIDEYGWFELVEPEAGARAMSFSPAFFEMNVSGRVTAPTVVAGAA